MLICGIKATHDGGIALIEDGRLLASVEIEKIDNNLRYSPLDRASRIDDVLAAEGLTSRDVDQFVVDGWYAAIGDDPEAPTVTFPDDRQRHKLRVAPYIHAAHRRDPLQRYVYSHHAIGGASGYSSFYHASNHLMGAYCTSPFAKNNEPALSLVWDGGMVPRLYDVDPRSRSVRIVSSLFPIPGNFFADVASFFGPFRRDTSSLEPEEKIRHHLSIAGKAMAYAALGTVEENAYSVFDDLIDDFTDVNVDNAFLLGARLSEHRDSLLPGITDADIIATLQGYIGNLLVTELVGVVSDKFPGQTRNLTISGGCALNIKWNTRIRETGMFDSVWIPPFPNDAGAAIGTATCEMWTRGGTALDWSAFSGPRAKVGEMPAGWDSSLCDEAGVASILHATGEPVVIIAGRAELGPRALGNRSILAPAHSPAMKARLNTMKGREDYRPIAPICLDDRSAAVFAPGGDDPYMLFEHRVRDEWRDRVPAIMHLDGTARLQTISRSSDVATARILVAYEALSGIPVLCNTSANGNGSGFFPDVLSAAIWGKAGYIWSDGVLYTRNSAAR